MLIWTEIALRGRQKGTHSPSAPVRTELQYAQHLSQRNLHASETLPAMLFRPSRRFEDWRV